MTPLSGLATIQSTMICPSSYPMKIDGILICPEYPSLAITSFSVFSITLSMIIAIWLPSASALVTFLVNVQSPLKVIKNLQVTLSLLILFDAFVEVLDIFLELAVGHRVGHDDFSHHLFAVSIYQDVSYGISPKLAMEYGIRLPFRSVNASMRGPGEYILRKQLDRARQTTIKSSLII